MTAGIPRQLEAYVFERACVCVRVHTHTHTHTHAYTPHSAQIGVRGGRHPGKMVGNKGERRKRLETAGPWGRGHQDSWQGPRSKAWGGETGQADGQGVPKGPRGFARALGGDRVWGLVSITTLDYWK